MSPPGDRERNGSFDDEGQPVGEISPSDADTGGGLDQALTPPADPQGLEEYGTTAREEREGEPLDIRLDREEPDFSEKAGGDLGEFREAGRLVEPASEEVDSVDTTSESIARDAGFESGGFSQEESAVHIEE